MPMQPSPIAETSRPLLPRDRLIIVFSLPVLFVALDGIQLSSLYSLDVIKPLPINHLLRTFGVAGAVHRDGRSCFVEAMQIIWCKFHCGRAKVLVQAV